MLSLRELIAQQSQESVDTRTEDAIASVQHESRRNYGNDSPTQSVSSSKHQSPLSPIKIDIDSSTSKRKAEATLALSPQQRHSKRSRPTVIEHHDDNDGDDESSAGEEWFGDDDDDDDDENDAVDRSAAFTELSKSLPQVLNAVYSSADPDQPQSLASLNQALHSKHKAITFQSRVDRLQPKTKELKKHGKTYIETETEEQAKERVFRTDRHVEKAKMAQRWQTRKINYTLEEDVGGVFARRVKRVLGPKFRKQARQQRAAREKEELKVKQEEAQKRNGVVDYDSEDEQNQLLDRLTQNSQSQTPMKAEEEEQKAAAVAALDPSIPLKDQLDFWQYGKAYPSKDDLAELDYDKLLQFELPVHPVEKEDEPKKLTVRERRKLQSQTIPLTKFFERKPQSKMETPEPCYFFPKTHGNTEKLDKFGHVRHFRAIAIRQLCSNSLDAARENRLIKGLLVKRKQGRISESIANFSALPTYKAMTHQLAANLLLYHENAWTDPVVVTEHLGLTGDLAGFTGTAVQVVEFFKSRRAFVKKHYLRKKDTSTSSSNVTKEKQTTDSQNKNGGDEEGSDEEYLPDDDESQASEEEVVEKNAGRLQNPESGAFGEMIPTTSLFAHIPGTKAPVPQMPLEPAGMLFGPVDKHAKFYHKSKINESTSRLIVSTLLSRMAEEQSNPTSDETTTATTTTKAQQDLKTFMDEYVQIHSAKTSNLFGRAYGMKDVANVHYYKSLMSYCSLLASGIPLESDSSSDIKQEDDDMYATEAVVRKQAMEIVKVLSSHVERNEIAKFPRLRIVFSLAHIASSLPESAAEVLSQAVDGEKIRTPLDLFRNTLEHMEEREMIVGQKEFPDDETVEAGNLEYLFFQASKRLQENIQVDALDLDHHLWYIGALASCLLLCSGNQIGGGAHIYPSGKSRTKGYGYSKCLPHEVRHKLPKFNEIRQALSSATKMLFQLAEYQKGPTVHLAVCSLLDWNEVVALLAGAATPNHCDSICRLYAHHAKELSLTEAGVESRTSLESKDRDCELELLARELENKPGNIEIWRKFARKLGPLGFENPEPAESSAADSAENSWLRDVRIVKKSNNWWGSNRQWWNEGLLHLRIQRRYKKNWAAMIEKLEQNMPECAPPGIAHMQPGGDAGDSEETSSIGWLPSEAVTSIRDSDERTLEDRGISFDEKLPNRRILPDGADIREDMETDEDATRNDGSAEFRLPELGVSDLGLELVCLKLLIFAHLNVDDLFKIEKYLHWLVNCCAIGDLRHFKGLDTDCPEFRALHWLCYVGLDIPKMLRVLFSCRHF